MHRALRHRPAARVLAGSAAVVLIGACTSPHHPSSSTPSTSTVAPTTSTSTTIAPGNTASAPGVTALQVTIGSHQPLTGSASAGADEIAPAANAYFQYVNDHGGVHGRTIVYKYVDDRYDASVASSAVRQLVTDGGVFAIFNGVGTPTDLAVRAFLIARGVPDLFVGSGCPCWNDVKGAPLTVGFEPDGVTEGTILGHAVTAGFPGQKVGYLLQGGAVASAAAAGLDRQIPAGAVVSRQTYDPGDASLAAQILALQHAGAQVVVSFALPSFTALALLAAAEADYHPRWVLASGGADVTTVTTQLQTLSKGAAGGSLLEGAVTDSYLAPIGDPTNPWTQLWRKVRDRYIPKLPLDGNVAYGMAAAYTFVEALASAGQNPTRAGIVRAVEQSHLSGPGLVPLAYSATSHRGYAGTEMGVIDTGQFRATGPPQAVSEAGVVEPSAPQVAVPGPNGIPAAP